VGALPACLPLPATTAFLQACPLPPFHLLYTCLQIVPRRDAPLPVARTPRSRRCCAAALLHCCGCITHACFKVAAVPATWEIGWEDVLRSEASVLLHLPEGWLYLYLEMAAVVGGHHIEMNEKQSERYHVDSQSAPISAKYLSAAIISAWHRWRMRKISMREREKLAAKATKGGESGKRRREGGDKQ